jgi:hypothetical protein
MKGVQQAKKENQLTNSYTFNTQNKLIDKKWGLSFFMLVLLEWRKNYVFQLSIAIEVPLETL